MFSYGLIDSLLNAPLALDRGSRLFGPSAGTSIRGVFPAVNAWERDEGFVLEAEIPGLDMDDLEVVVHGRTLTLRGERKLPQREGAERVRRERLVGRFERTFEFATPIDAEGVEARLDRGVLTVVLPKVAEARPRRIAVRTPAALENSADATPDAQS